MKIEKKEDRCLEELLAFLTRVLLFQLSLNPSVVGRYVELHEEFERLLKKYNLLKEVES